jgi:hypothetical protein
LRKPTYRGRFAKADPLPRRVRQEIRPKASEEEQADWLMQVRDGADALTSDFTISGDAWKSIEKDAPCRSIAG